MRLSLKTAPAALPLDWATVKGQLRLDADEEQARIESVLVPAAVDWVESLTSRALITQTWYGRLDRFPDEDYIVIPKPPLASITSVSYVDGDGVTQVLAPAKYVVEALAGLRALHGKVHLAYNETWPTTRAQANAVTIEFVCGYGATPASVPGALRQALLVLIDEMFTYRQDSITGTIVSPAQIGAKALALPFLAESA